MTFFFNLETLEAETLGNPRLMIDALYMFYNKKHIARSKYSKTKPIRNLVGNSYLINPEAFFSDNTTDIIYKSQYIQLAGRRDYSLYKLFNQNYLDLSYFSDIDISKIKTNPLINITENKIHFKYEEIKNGN
jgi:hypothetical protein